LSELIINCLKLRLCCDGTNAGASFNADGTNADGTNAGAGSDFGFLAFGFFCDCWCGDGDLIIKWLGDGSINNGFGGGGIGI
jgi:hypothetical protein